MRSVSIFRAPSVAMGPLLAIGAALAACAVNPGPEEGSPRPSGSAPSGPAVNVAQLQLHVYDQDGRPLYNADVSLRPIGGGSYRGRERTSLAGEVVFDRVPPQEVQADVHYERMDREPNGMTRIARGTGAKRIDVGAEYVQDEMRIEVITQIRP